MVPYWTISIDAVASKTHAPREAEPPPDQQGRQGDVQEDAEIEEIRVWDHVRASARLRRSASWLFFPGKTWDRVVVKAVEDLVVRQQPFGSEVPHRIAAEGLIGIVIGEVDDRSVIAGTDRAELFVVGPSGGVRDATVIVPAAVDRHAQQERPGTELVQLAQEKLQIDPFLVPLQRAEKSLLRPGVSQSQLSWRNLPSHFSLSSPNSLLLE